VTTSTSECKRCYMSERRSLPRTPRPASRNQQAPTLTAAAAAAHYIVSRSTGVNSGVPVDEGGPGRIAGSASPSSHSSGYSFWSTPAPSSPASSVQMFLQPGGGGGGKR